MNLLKEIFLDPYNIFSAGVSLTVTGALVAPLVREITRLPGIGKRQIVGLLAVGVTLVACLVEASKLYFWSDSTLNLSAMLLAITLLSWTAAVLFSYLIIRKRPKEAGNGGVSNANWKHWVPWIIFTLSGACSFYASVRVATAFDGKLLVEVIDYDPNEFVDSITVGENEYPVSHFSPLGVFRGNRSHGGSPYTRFSLEYDKDLLGRFQYLSVSRFDGKQNTEIELKGDWFNVEPSRSRWQAHLYRISVKRHREAIQGKLNELDDAAKDL